MPIYTETQQNKYRWLSCIVLVSLQWAATLYVLQLVELLSVYVTITVSFSILLILLSMWGFILFQRLDTNIDNNGVHFRAPLSWANWQTILWADIDRIYVREYALRGEYPRGILGLRQGPGGLAYAPRYGFFGLQIEKKTGGRILLGTQCPDELRSFLLNRSAENPVSQA